MASFELFIAARYLRAKRRQAVVGVITMICTLGVAVGVASLVIALSINNGFQKALQESLLGSTCHVNLMRVENDGIEDWRGLAQKMEQQPHVTGAAPVLYEQVLISRGARAGGAILKGIVPSRERRVSSMLDEVRWGSAAELETGAQALPETSAAADDASSLVGEQQRLQAMPPIVLGKEMADDLGATVGSVVMVTSPQGEMTPFGIVPKYQRCRVVGVFESGFSEYDATWAFIALPDAQKLFGLGDIATVLELKLDDLNRAEQMAPQLAQAAGTGFSATSWQEQNKTFFRFLRLMHVVIFITIGLIVLVAALNILISLIMMVMEKQKDIAVLVSMGCTRRQIRRIFIWQGLLIGLAGTLLGEVVGFTFAYFAGHYRWLRISSGITLMDYVPFAPRWTDGVVVALVALGVSYVATLHPSRSAARVLPAEMLRYE